ncbi:hypothetical protein [Streptomyces sp. NPDC057412]|uniref:hypothetical protein n=1 Tax=Streptomyces sp. NPDC057412 TaxID=3346123 RepID=UPI0036C232BA
MTNTHQEHPSTSTTRTTTAAPVAARSRPIGAHARDYATRHGDPLTWSAEKWRMYLDLGGAA